MSDTPTIIPDRVSTLELSKLWIHKALQEFEQELQAQELRAQENQEPQSEEDDSAC
ncbi:MAG TPA: hypothetical protein V6C64_16770 [Microcoleaceae cyanobacterium]|jgi:hypothetical protein